MNRAFEDALVTGYEPLIACLKLPDPKNRHVLAAAIRGRAVRRYALPTRTVAGVDVSIEPSRVAQFKE
jgi:hypothetical protein